MHRLEQNWYRISAPHLILWPLSLTFGAVAAARRALYRAGALKTLHLPVPVIIVGNITVGGTGKTPLVVCLAHFLRDRGHTPGIVSRGYMSNGGSACMPRQVQPDSDPRTVGDEPLLLARRAGCPVWVGRRRSAAARALLAAHPDCSVIISDDGLQHYALARDVEIAVIDGERGFGNGMLLPAGPLREPPERLERTDAIVTNGAALFPHEELPPAVPIFEMQLAGDIFYNLLNPEQQVGPEHFLQHHVHAIAGIGNPHRFFEHLRDLGVSFNAHPFSDHHAFTAEDLVFPSGNDAIIMTEKDAVKCERFGNENCWVLRVDAEVESGLGELVLRKLKKSPH
jgi:tetraacyldisaccharide 4'-kinase